MDNIDKIITNVVSNQIYEPIEIEKNIQNTLIYKPTRLRLKFSKLIPIAGVIVFTISGIVYAGYKITKNIFNNRKGFQSAIEHNYISDGTIEYNESNNIFIKIDNSLMNDKNLDINFSIILNGHNINNIENIEFEKLLIHDEENKVLYSNNQEQLKTYIQNNNLDLSIGNFNDKYFNSGFSAKSKLKSENCLNLIYNIVCNTIYPQSKEINILAENIIIRKDDSYEVVEGKWNINEQLPLIFQNRKAYQYYLQDNNHNDIKDINLTVYNTETEIKIIMPDNNIMNNNIDTIELSKKIEQAKKENNIDIVMDIEQQIQNLSGNIKNTFTELYILNSYGEKFEISDSENLHGEIYVDKDNIVYSDIIDLTIYEVTNNIELHFVYNNKEYLVKLIR